MELGKGIEVSFSGLKLTATLDVAVLFLDGVEEKIKSGEIDIIKGTDLDKTALLAAIAYLKTLSV